MSNFSYLYEPLSTLISLVFIISFIWEQYQDIHEIYFIFKKKWCNKKMIFFVNFITNNQIQSFIIVNNCYYLSR